MANLLRGFIGYIKKGDISLIGKVPRGGIAIIAVFKRGYIRWLGQEGTKVRILKPIKVVPM